MVKEHHLFSIIAYLAVPFYSILKRRYYGSVYNVFFEAGLAMRDPQRILMLHSTRDAEGDQGVNHD